MNTIKETVDELATAFEKDLVSAITEDTKELVDVHIMFDPFVNPFDMLRPDLTDEQINQMPSVRLVRRYIDMLRDEGEITPEIIASRNSYMNNLYDAHKYFPYFDMALQGLNLTSDRRNDTRQMVVTFAPDHCYETLHFMVRDTVLIFICNMRSCNFKKNLVDDIFMMCLLMDQVKLVLEKQMKITIPRIIPCFNIGSLHMFLKDEKKKKLDKCDKVVPILGAKKDQVN